MLPRTKPWRWLDPLLQTRIPKRLLLLAGHGAFPAFGGEQAFDAAADLAGPRPYQAHTFGTGEPDFRDCD